MVGLRHESTSYAWSKISSDSPEDEASSKKPVEDGLECPVCWEGFDNLENVPYVLWCGHSLCKSCVMGLQWAIVKLPVVPVQLPLFISCPWCQFLSCRLFWKGKLKFPCKNFFLLWMIESVKGGIRKCHVGSRVDERLSLGPMKTLKNQNTFEKHGRRHSHGNAGQTQPYSIRHFSLPGTLDMRIQQHLDEFFLRRWFKNIVGLCAQLMAKFMLAVLVMFILFCVLPFCTVILVVYFIVTLIFAFPSLLAVYFTFPSLRWLLREIVT